MVCQQLSCLLLLLLTTHVANAQPTYQVSIYLSVHPRVPLVPLCSGVILQRRIVLTTASCVTLDYTLDASGPVATADAGKTPVAAARLRVVAGQMNVADEMAALSVDAVHVTQSFDAATLTNDLAVLRLKQPLPLGLRDDMKWIVPDDSEHTDNDCSASFQANNLIDAIPDNQEEESIQLMPPNHCGIEMAMHSRDFCSHYTLPQSFNCEQYEEQRRFNTDRGTGVVCSSRVVALLSQTMPLSVPAEWQCLQRSVPAMYVAVAPHIDWIYEFIITEEYADMASNNYVSSLPYDQNDPKVTDKPGKQDISSTTNIDTTISISVPTTTATTTTTIIPTTINSNSSDSEQTTNTAQPPTALPTVDFDDGGIGGVSSSGASASYHCANTMPLQQVICCLLLLSFVAAAVKQ